jgi:hypothetical protein
MTTRAQRSIATALLLLWFAAAGAAADLFLFRGEFIYIIPRVLGDEMVRLTGRDEWQQFSQHTRYLDLDGDGREEFVAVAFGASSGHGAQVRYRLRYLDDGTRRLGRWYWGVVTDPQGARLFEQFNL